MSAFKQALEKEKISLVIRQSDQGLVYGLTYVDHSTKCVFNGSDIGKQYSAKGILENCGIVQSIPEQAKAIEHTPTSQTIKQQPSHEPTPSKQLDIGKIIEEVIKPTEEIHYLPYELKKRRKKRKRNQ